MKDNGEEAVMAKGRAVDRAKTYLAQIRKNVDDFYGDRLTYEAFSAEQRRIWDAVNAEGAAVRGAVDAALLENLRRVA